MKVRLSLASLKPATVESIMPAQYTMLKDTLARKKNTLNLSLSAIEEKSSWRWMEIANLHKNFAELLSDNIRLDSPVFSHAEKTIADIDSLHAKFIEPTSITDAPSMMIGHVRAYITDIEDIEKEYKSVERKAAEKQRYEKKVAKLTTKEKNIGKTHRNMEKLEGARVGFRNAVEALMERMEETNKKYEAVIQCAQTAFWLHQNKFIKLVQEKSMYAREVAAALSERVEQLDVTKTELVAVDVASGQETRQIVEGASDAATAGANTGTTNGKASA